MIKPGRTAEAAQAAASHTGSMTGSDDVLDAAFRRVGVLRVNTVAELFFMADVLDKQPLPTGPRLTILSNAGGPAVLAADALISGGGELATLAPETHERLNACLPRHWSRNNPVDIIGDADADRYVTALKELVKDQNTDGFLFMFAPQDLAGSATVAQKIVENIQFQSKPALASWMGGAEAEKGEKILRAHDVPAFSYPDTAAKIFNYMWRYKRNLELL